MARAPFRITDMRVIGALAPQTGDVTAPTIPQNVLATAINAGRVDLSWTASTDDFGVSGYQIFRNGSPLTTTSSTTLSDTTCQPSTFYSYVVVAFDGAGNSSAPSNPGTATTPANVAPAWQSVPSQTIIVGNSFLLQLTDYCTDADLDTITFSITSGTLPTGLSLSGSRIQGTPTTAGQSPTVTVQAADAFHQISTTIAFSTKTSDVTAPPVPTGLAATAISTSSIQVSWNASVDAAGSSNELVTGTQDYRLYRSTDNVSFSLRTTVATTSYTDTGLSSGTTYYYKITARDVALNESTQSASANAATQGGGSLTMDDEWAQWAGASGVVLAQRFDTLSAITNQYTVGISSSRVALDATNTLGSGHGTMQFRIQPGDGGTEPAGHWGNANNMGGQFGAGSNLYMKFSFMVNSSLLNLGGNNWKIFSVFNAGAPCQTCEMTLVRPIVGNWLYHSCGNNHSTGVNDYFARDNTPDYAYQQDWDVDTVGPPYLHMPNGYMSKYLASGQIDSPKFQFTAGAWYDIYFVCRLGALSGYTSTPRNSKFYIETHKFGDPLGRRRSMAVVGNLPFTNNGSDKLANLQFTNYCTGGTSSPSTTATSNYGQLIISTQPIAQRTVFA